VAVLGVFVGAMETCVELIDTSEPLVTCRWTHVLAADGRC